VSLLISEATEGDLLDIETARRVLGVGRATLYRLRRSDQLGSVMHGGRPRFRRADLIRLRDEGWEVPRGGWPDDPPRAPDPYGRLTLDALPHGRQRDLDDRDERLTLDPIP
jgi:excisionase family DNA binding protein